MRDPPQEKIRASLHLISHAADVPILLAAIHAEVDYLVTLNRLHFIDDPQVAEQTRLRIGTLGDALQWIREQLSAEGGRERFPHRVGALF